jgi:hypothetical protein
MRGASPARWLFSGPSRWLLYVSTCFSSADPVLVVSVAFCAEWDNISLPEG